ncbi:MAG: hypothetical protein D8B54_00060 [Catonella sp.]|nr:MAG: hypothetical protein D8B54_00060 [Catonella sp.]
MPNYILEHKGVKGMKWLKGRKTQLPPIKRPPEERLKNIPENVMKKLSPEVKKRIREILGKKSVIEHHGVKGMKWGVIRNRISRATRASVKLALRGTKATVRGLKRGGIVVGKALNRRIRAHLAKRKALKASRRAQDELIKQVLKGKLSSVPDDISLHPNGLSGKKLKQYQKNVVKLLTDKQVTRKKTAEDERVQLLTALGQRPHKSRFIKPILDDVIPGLVKSTSKKFLSRVADIGYERYANPALKQIRDFLKADSNNKPEKDKPKEDVAKESAKDFDGDKPKEDKKEKKKDK